MVVRRARVVGVVLALLLVSYGSTTALLPGRVQGILYVPLNLAVAAGLLIWGRRAGLTREDVGVNRKWVGLGLRWGLAAGLALGAPVFAVSLMFGGGDPRLEGLGWPQVAYAALLRIPLGTAGFEEVAFRGVLQAVMMRGFGTWRGLTLASATFGLWHIVPAADVLRAADTGNWPGYVIYLGAGLSVVFTFVGGILLGWLRLKGRHLTAPWAVHALINDAALAGGYLGARMGWAPPLV